MRRVIALGRHDEAGCREVGPGTGVRRALRQRREQACCLAGSSGDEMRDGRRMLRLHRPVSGGPIEHVARGTDKFHLSRIERLDADPVRRPEGRPGKAAAEARLDVAAAERRRCNKGANALIGTPGGGRPVRK